MSEVMDRRFELTDEDIEAVADRIRSVETRHDVRAAVEVGRIILDELFDGDVAAVRSKDLNKATSLRRLARQLGRPATRLSVAVRIRLQYDRFDPALRDRLSATHHEVLLAAPEYERERLGREAALAGLSVQQLRILIATGEIVPDPEPPDRSAIAVMERNVERLRKTALAAVGTDAAPVYADRIDTLLAELLAVRDALREK